MTKTANTSRDVTVQVPGEAAPVVDQSQGAEAQPVRRTRPQENAQVEGVQPGAELNVDPADTTGAIPAYVMDRARAQARAELQQDIREAQAGIQAASTVLEEADPLPVATRRSYAKMRAADIDPTKLTAPVMTLDGWLCPPAPEKK